MGVVRPVHARIVHTDVTLGVIQDDSGPSTSDNLDSAVARHSARRAEGTLVHGCGLLRTGPAGPMEGT